jgi:hypothetical protein
VSRIGGIAAAVVGAGVGTGVGATVAGADGVGDGVVDGVAVGLPARDAVGLEDDGRATTADGVEPPVRGALGDDGAV